MRRELTATTTSEIRTELLKAGQQMGGPATGVVLNLIIMTDESAQHDAMRAASQASREHPCRVIGVIARPDRFDSRLDAEITVGENAPGQLVVLRIYGELSLHADSVITPLLVPDTPVVTWWPGRGPAVPAADPLGMLAQRRITDAASSPAPRDCLDSLASHYQPGDTDLSWTRATTWRSLLAATLDQPHGEITGGAVSAEETNPTADLIAAWLSGRLGAGFRRDVSGGPGITGVRFQTSDGDITITRPDGRTATLSRPGDPERRVALHRREIAELLAEELRRLNPDEVYGETLAAFAASTAAGSPAPRRPARQRR
jgi:glucose-6-phosphate dehydrogenase assembly protein OpcA